MVEHEALKRQRWLLVGLLSLFESGCLASLTGIGVLLQNLDTEVGSSGERLYTAQ